MTQLTTSSLVEEFDRSTKIAQIFSGAFFGFVVVYLVFSNSTKLSFIQQASQEKRLAVCCNIGTAVAAISAFLSVFQITEVDNHLLPENGSYTVDLARPVEWILTCPLMQLTLVLMGGSRIPESRRLLMPFLSATIVGLGTLALFLDELGAWVCYAGGLTFFLIMTYFNRLQIIEHSNGMEGFFRGESEFRKATLILVGTWIPFPVWYSLSPEGFSVIDNVLIIQMGWMFLNMIAKGSSILYIQRSKDNYVARLKVNKLMKNNAAAQRFMSDDPGKQANATLGPCVAETFAYLGMADKTERFMRLLREAKIYTLEQVETLTQEECEQKKLPFDLIVAVQKRQRNWKLEVQCDAEEGLEKGEAFYAKQGPDLLDMSDPSRQVSLENPPPPPPGGFDNRQMNMMNQRIQQAQVGKFNPNPFDEATNSTAPSPVSNEELLGKLTTLEEHLRAMASWEEKLDNVRAIATWEEKLDNGLQSVCQVVENHSITCQNSVERGFKSVDRGLQSFDSSLKNISNCLDTSLKGIGSSLDTSLKGIGGSLDTSLRGIDTSIRNNSQNNSVGIPEEKIEIIFSNHEKKQQHAQQDMQDRLAQLSQKFAEHSAAMAKANEGNITTIGKFVQEAFIKIGESSSASNQSHSANRGASISTEAIATVVDKAVASWAQQIITDGRSNNFTLQNRIAAVEEAQVRNQEETEDRLADRIEAGVKSTMENCFGRLESEYSRDRLQLEEANAGKLDRLRAEILDCIHRATFDANTFDGLNTEMSNSVEKHVQIGVGILTNTFREQIDILHDSQMNVEGRLALQLDTVKSDMDNVKAEIMERSEMRLKKSLGEQDQRLQKFEGLFKKDMDTQKELCCSVLEQAAGAQIRSKECYEVLTTLSERLNLAYSSELAGLGGATGPRYTPEYGIPTSIQDLRQSSSMTRQTTAESSVSMRRPSTAGGRRRDIQTPSQQAEQPRDQPRDSPSPTRQPRGV